MNLPKDNDYQTRETKKKENPAICQLQNTNLEELGKFQNT